jgi:NAD(P)H-dependent FMN reductase
MPAAVTGVSIGQIGTGMSQQLARGVLSFCNARQMTFARGVHPLLRRGVP